MARFYGWDLPTINKMPINEFEAFYLSIDPLTAQESLESLNVISFPHLKQTDRKNILTSLRKRSRQSIDMSENKLATYGSVMESLRSKLNGLR